MQKILIVEDDADIQDILKNHLIDAGYEVVVASDGVAGIAMFDDTINLILLDIMLVRCNLFKHCRGYLCKCIGFGHTKGFNIRNGKYIRHRYSLSGYRRWTNQR